MTVETSPIPTKFSDLLDIVSTLSPDYYDPIRGVNFFDTTDNTLVFREKASESQSQLELLIFKEPYDNGSIGWTITEDGDSPQLSVGNETALLSLFARVFDSHNLQGVEVVEENDSVVVSLSEVKYRFKLNPNVEILHGSVEISR